MKVTITIQETFHPDGGGMRIVGENAYRNSRGFEISANLEEAATLWMVGDEQIAHPPLTDEQLDELERLLNIIITPYL